MRLGLTVAVGVALLSAAPAYGAVKAKTVTVSDNAYSSKTVTVDRSATVTWRWPSYEEAGDVHDVKLKAGPKGAKKFQSEAASTDYSFKRKLTVPGTYKIICSLHEEMHMTIRVRR